MDHFKGALKGQGLTPARRRKIQEWENGVHEGDATVDDVTELERILKQPIILRDIAGKDIYNNGKYRSRRADMELIVHSGHAWPKDFHFPQSRELHFYEGNVWQAIRGANHDSPLAVWLLGRGEDAHERRLSVNQFVLQDGRIYRTQEAHERLQVLCARLGNTELAERALGENHAASIMERKRTPRSQRQPASSPGHSEGLCGARTRRAVELDGLRHEGRRQHRYKGLLSGILQGYG